MGASPTSDKNELLVDQYSDTSVAPSYQPITPDQLGYGADYGDDYGDDSGDDDFGSSGYDDGGDDDDDGGGGRRRRRRRRRDRDDKKGKKKKRKKARKVSAYYAQRRHSRHYGPGSRLHENDKKYKFTRTKRGKIRVRRASNEEYRRKSFAHKKRRDSERRAGRSLAKALARQRRKRRKR